MADRWGQFRSDLARPTRFDTQPTPIALVVEVHYFHEGPDAA